jgi:hypothetical protein
MASEKKTTRIVIAEDEAIIRLDLRETLEEVMKLLPTRGAAIQQLNWCANINPT